jgi:hypothetical protein
VISVWCIFIYTAGCRVWNAELLKVLLSPNMQCMAYRLTRTSPKTRRENVRRRCRTVLVHWIASSFTTPLVKPPVHPISSYYSLLCSVRRVYLNQQLVVVGPIAQIVFRWINESNLSVWVLAAGGSRAVMFPWRRLRTYVRGKKHITSIQARYGGNDLCLGARCVHQPVAGITYTDTITQKWKWSWWCVKTRRAGRVIDI